MDWIRVIVFDILIFWHVGLFFVSWADLVQWDMPMKNNVQLSFLSWPMLFIRQWRLPILFLVSGIGTFYSLSSKSGGQYLKDRFIRLFIPLLTGIFIVVPPQVYLERLIQGTVNTSYMEYYPSTFTGIYPDGNFSWSHLWFLPYLLIMSVLALPIFLYIRNKGARLFTSLKRLIEKSPLLLYLFVVPLIGIEISLESRYPLTMALKDDWYAFSYYFVCFMAGYTLANLGKSLWNAFIIIRYYALATGIVASILVLWMLSIGESPLWLHFIKPVNVWSWILSIFGFSAKYLNKGSSLLAYRNTAVYSFYILHYTIIVILGFLLMNHPMHVAFKMIIMLTGTYGLSWILYEYLIRRSQILRPLFGLKIKQKSR